jgi:hypothetical protein
VKYLRRYTPGGAAPDPAVPPDPLNPA